MKGELTAEKLNKKLNQAVEQLTPSKNTFFNHKEPTPEMREPLLTQSQPYFSDNDGAITLNSPSPKSPVEPTGPGIEMRTFSKRQ